MKIQENFNTSNLRKREIKYPVYQTTNRFYNLYTDVRTFVRELIQNADDAGAENFHVKIDLLKQIEIMNDGKTFNLDDIDRLLTPSKGGKRIDQTGDLNLGALSVLTVSDHPLYHSGTTLLKFELNHQTEEFIPFIDENYSEYFNGTKIILPLHSRLSDEDIQKLKKIDEYLAQYPHLLFSKNLKNITIQYPNRSYRFKKKIESEKNFKYNGIDSKIINLSLERQLDDNSNKNHEEKWLIAKSEIKIPQKYFREKVFQENNTGFKFPLYLAFLLQNNIPERVDFPIYIIFPSDTQLGLGFVLSSNFKPDTSRKGFATTSSEGEFNRFLLGKSSQLLNLVLNYFKEVISNKKKSERKEIFKGLLASLFYTETLTSLEPYIQRYLLKEIKDFLRENILNSIGIWNKASDTIMAKKEIWGFIEDKGALIEPFLVNDINELLKSVGVSEYKTEQLIYDVTKGRIADSNRLIEAWDYLIKHQSQLNERHIANYLLEYLSDPSSFSENDLSKENFLKILDYVYSYLGNSNNFKKLPVNIKQRLKSEAIIYVSSLDSFLKPKDVIIHSLDAEKVYGKDKFYIKNRDFPNSTPFFKLVGVKTTLKTDHIAEYLIEYINQGKIETNKLLSLYSILGERFNYISEKHKKSLQNSKIVINKELNEFEFPSNIFIPDEKKYIEEFPLIKICLIERKIIDFFEKIGVRKVSEVVAKRIIISGVVLESDYSKLLSHRLKELVPFIEVILKDTNTRTDKDWKKRIYSFKCVESDQILQELNFETERKRIQARTVEFIPEKQQIVILKNIHAINPPLFILDLARAISGIIFIGNVSNARLVSPIIEKLLQSDDKKFMLKELGFSTYTLEMKGVSNQNVNITGPQIANTKEISKFNKNNIIKYYQIEDSVKNFLAEHNKKLYKSLEFPSRTTYGGVEQKPQIPKLILEKKRNFHYYIQENLELASTLESLEKFDQMLKFIVECMEGNPETVSVAIFEASLHGFNFNGQIYFNYLMLMDDALRREIDLYFIWIIVAAHELAHSISRSHDQLHSRYTMILAIRALKNIEMIRNKYFGLFS